MSGPDIPEPKSQGPQVQVGNLQPSLRPTPPLPRQMFGGPSTNMSQALFNPAGQRDNAMALLRRGGYI